MSLPARLRYRLYRFKRLQGSVHSLALGAAIGAAISITPTIPLQHPHSRRHPALPLRPHRQHPRRHRGE